MDVKGSSSMEYSSARDVNATEAIMTNRSRGRILIWMVRHAFCLTMLYGLLTASAQSVPTVLTGGVYNTPSDLARFRQQASNSELRDVYRKIQSESHDAVHAWEQRFPANGQPRSTDELMAAGRANGVRNNGYIPLALETVLDPSAENKRVLREMMMFALGTHQKLNYWNALGIHEAIPASEYLEVYDIANQFGVLTPSDHAAIREEMHRVGHFLDGWLLDNTHSRMYPDKRDTAWCMNFHIMSASTLGWIAMLYPDFPESFTWLREGQSALMQHLMNGFGEDGAYGEGSIHYWELAMRGMLNFFTVSRNLGVSDYLKVPAIEDRMRATLRWRINMTAPDGYEFAIGDSDRANDAGAYLIEAGTLLNDPDAIWAGRMMLERANRWVFHERSLLFYPHLNMALAGRAANNTQALFPLSGFAAFRSGWDSKSNAMFFKYGSTYIGRREADRNPVISGHAHEDALEFELHYHGVPVITDIGRHGHYETWNTYGGFMKASIAHSTVGLGNPWGYDRLDGQYAKHQAEHGHDFTYEQTQQNINPADSKLMAYADLGKVAYVSARDRTFDAVQHQRSVLWFSDDSLMVVVDRLESKDEQPYEWYLTPTGKPLGKAGDLLFGDTAAKVQVVPISPATERVTSIAPGMPNLPPYYIDLAPGLLSQGEQPERWSTFSLLILQQKAKNADFLNVLLPFSGDSNPWSMTQEGNDTRRFSQGSREVLVAGRDAQGTLSLSGQCGMVERSGIDEQSYALIEGTSLHADAKTLIVASLSTPVWKGLYSTELNALVSLKDKRASFDLKPWPGDEHLLLNPPLAVPGQEPTAPLLVTVSFRVAAKPTRIIVQHGFTGTPQLNDPEADAWDKWPRDWHRNVARREPLKFIYDSATGLVSVELEPGAHQIVWE
jgi:hypothetical protein